MRTLLVTGSDTGVGKTHVVATLARILGQTSAHIQIVKVVETGRSADSRAEGDAERARRCCGAVAEAVTLASFPAPLSPPVAAAAAGSALSLEMLVDRLRGLPPCDWRILEGAGGIATPIDDRNRDWVDFAATVDVDATILVVPDRLGAINQARLACAWAARYKLRAGVWLNATMPVEGAVSAANRESLRSAGVPVWAVQAHGADRPLQPSELRACLASVEERDEHAVCADSSADHASTLEGAAAVAGTDVARRCVEALRERDRRGLQRTLRVTDFREGVLNLADNDYLGLAHDPSITDAAAAAMAEHGTSASASPLISGWRRPHARLVERLCAWHRFDYGLLWSSGYAANAAVLGALPARSDLVLADRLIHHSMIAGLLRSGAALKRYAHLGMDALEERLAQAGPSGRQVFVVTESVFSMEGDFPDLARMARLKREYGFFWVVDEAHALGWYGSEGAGLARAAGVEHLIDVLVGTLGKTLASGGAYALFRTEAVRDYLVNTAGEFIYSTALPPANAAAALAALERVRALSVDQSKWQAVSRRFRLRLQAEGWAAPSGDSPIVPVRLDHAGAAVSLAEHLGRAGVMAAAVRPPTVPAGTSRVRFSLKRSFGEAEAERIVAAMNAWRAAQ